MTKSVNPYAPPSIDARSTRSFRSWLKALVAGFWRIPVTGSPDFANGEAIIVSGIAYFIDPSDNKTLFAGSPSEDRSDRRLAFVASEAIRYLPYLFEDRPDLIQDLSSRRLVVRIVDSYQGIWSDYYRAAQALSAPLGDHLPTDRKTED